MENYANNFSFRCYVTVKMNIAAENVEVEVPLGTSRLTGSENGNRFVETEYQSKLMTEIIQTFAVGEICLVGKFFFGIRYTFYWKQQSSRNNEMAIHA